MTRRVERLNSLLKEVISDVIRLEIKTPNISSLLTVTNVEITKDLSHAKVFVSVIGDETEKQSTLDALKHAAGAIGVLSAKKVVMRHFPSLTFYLDDSVDKYMHIDALLKKIEDDKRPAANDAES